MLKTKEQLVGERLGSVTEAYKIGDTYMIKLSIPKTIVNGFISKAKKEGIETKENFSDSDIAELIAAYVANTFINVDSLPVAGVLGDSDKKEVRAEVQPTEVPQPMNAQPIQPISDVTAAQPLTPAQSEISSEIQIL